MNVVTRLGFQKEWPNSTEFLQATDFKRSFPVPEMSDVSKVFEGDDIFTFSKDITDMSYRESEKNRT